jgi:NAD+ diphosphatase
VPQAIPWPTIPFAGGDLDRADVHRREPEWIAARLEDPTSRLLLLWRGKPLVTKGGGLALLSPAEVEPLRTLALPPVFLGLRGERAVFAITLGGDSPPVDMPSGLAFLEPRSAVSSFSPGDAGAFAQARSLFEWHRHHGYCARCGAATDITDAGHKRRCPACGAEHFPRTDPVVIMMITRGDRCLLGRQPRFPPQLFTCLAGFLEPGETVEDAVRRESFEEAGIRCGEVRYVGCQPWPFPSQLMLGCTAEALGEDITIDGEELAEARWFERAEVQAMLTGGGGLWVPPAIAIAHHLIARWAAQPSADSDE